MAVDTKKPAVAKPKTPRASSTAAAGTKPATRAKTTIAAAPAARRRAPATAKRTTEAAKNPPARPSAARKSPPVKKAAHEPEPFAVQGDKAGKPPKAKKTKLIRDSVTMPEGEYALIATLKRRCLDAGVSAKKNEILRAAVANLAKLSDTSVLAAVRRLETIRTGRSARKPK